MKYLKYFESNIDFDDWDIEEDEPPGVDVDNFCMLYFYSKYFLCYKTNKSYIGETDEKKGLYLWNVDKKSKYLKCLIYEKSISIGKNCHIYPATEDDIKEKLNKNKLDYLLKYNTKDKLNSSVLGRKVFEGVDVDPLFVRDHSYNFDYFKDKLNIDLNI
jgi:hypothetical protein